MAMAVVVELLVELGKEGRSYMKRRSRRNIVGAKPYMAPPWCRWPQAKEPLRSGWEVPPMKMSLSSTKGGAAIMNFIVVDPLIVLPGEAAVGNQGWLDF